MKHLLANLKAGTRLLAFRATEVSDFRFSADQWVLLALLLVGLRAAEYWRVPGGELNVFAFPDVSLLLLSMLFAGYLTSRLWRDVGLIALPVMMLSIAVPVSLFMDAAAWLWSGRPSLLEGSTWLIAAWGAWALARGVYVLAGRRAAHALIGMILTTIVLLPQALFIGLSDFWQAPAPSAFQEDLLPPPVDGEEIMYAQPALLEAAFSRLQPQRPGVADIYFLGFAGDATQDVFAKEAEYVKALWDERYDSKGRSLLLVNSASTADTQPIASVTNLELALRRMAEVMDPDEDVLVLFLTSHGSQEFELATNFPPLPLNPVTPEQLKRVLDDAGVKWRVLIVSACYSGGYVPPLKNAHTVVMTAASADRTSFGCDTDRDFTYFGEAYFRDELARGVPLLDSFRNAAANIEKREKQEGLTPSQPQLFVGDEIAARLPAWEASWLARRCAGRVEAC